MDTRFRSFNVLILHITLDFNHFNDYSFFFLVLVKTCRPLGMESYFIQDSQITASSKWDAGHGARNARLNLQASSGIRNGGWAAGQNILNQWLQVDFIKTVTLAKVATQGRMDADQWVTSFSLSYSMDGNVFKVYQQSGSDKVSVTQWQKKKKPFNK